MSTIDLTVLESLERDLGDRDVVCEVVGVYLELLPERHRAIAESAWANDLVRLRREAHTLGSASAVVGAIELRGLCRQLESPQLPRANIAFQDVLSAWASSCAATERALNLWLTAS